MIGLSRIQRYIFVANFRTLVIVMGVIMLAILLVDTVEQISTIGTRADINLLQALGFSFMKLPTLVEQTLPFGLLIAAMLTFRQLSARAELPVIRASGLSAWRFLTPSIVLALLMGLFTMAAVSPIGSYFSKKYEAERASLLETRGGEIAQSGTGIWLRDGNELIQTIINADSIDTTGTVLKNVRFIQQERVFNNDSREDVFIFLRRLDASQAKLERGFWQLEDVIEYTPDSPAKALVRLSFSTDMEQATLIDRFRTPTHIGYWQLPAYIETSEAAGIDASKLRMRYFSITAIPVMFTAMSLIGALACLRLVRLGRTAPFIAFGTGSAVALYFVNQLGSSLGTIGAIPPLVAALSPPIFAVFACLALVAYNEDG